MSVGFFDKYEVLKIFPEFGHIEPLVHKALAPSMVKTLKKPKTEWFRIPFDELVEKINSIISEFEH